MPKRRTDPAHAWDRVGGPGLGRRGRVRSRYTRADRRSHGPHRTTPGRCTVPGPIAATLHAVRERERALMPVVAVWEPEGENWIRWGAHPGARCVLVLP